MARDLDKTKVKRKKQRREKIKKLRKKYFLAQTKEEKEKIIEKALRLSFHLTREKFLEPIKKESSAKKSPAN